MHLSRNLLKNLFQEELPMSKGITEENIIGFFLWMEESLYH